MKKNKPNEFYYSYTDPKSKKNKLLGMFSPEDFVDPQLQKDLMGNPFLYNANTTSAYVSSIEDFAIEHKKQRIYFGEFVRNPNLKKSIKLKEVKKKFKEWNKDFKQRHQTVSENGEKAIDVVARTNLKIFSWRMSLLLFIMILLNIIFASFLTGLVNKLIKIEYISNVCTKLLEMFKSTFWIDIIVFLPLVFLILIIVLSISNSIKINKFKTLKRKSKKYIQKSEKNIKKDFNKNYPKAYNYYIKQIKRKKVKFDPIPISDITCNKFDISEMEKITSEAMFTAEGQDKLRSKRVRSIKTCLTFLTLSTIVTIGILIYVLVTNIKF